MKRQVAASLVAVGLLAAACGSGSGTGAVKRLDANDVAMVRPAPNVDITSLAAGTRALGFSLGGRLAANTTNGNMVYSPTSLAVAFAMLREGARGRTATTIDRVLDLPKARQTSYNALVTALQNPGPGNTLDIGNGLFLDPRLSVERSYLVALKRWYGAGLYQTQFPSPALDDINSYVDTETHGRIPHLLDQLDDKDVFALINTVYLNAKWQTEFDPADTHDASFAVSSSHHATVKMMHRIGATDYASGRGWQAVRLPYTGNRLSMWVMLPTGTTKPLDLLAPKALAAANAGFTSRDVDLSLPRWDIDNFFNIKDALESLGLTSTFDGAGNFRGITTDPTFALAHVLQQANITVGEHGTIAAAATAAIAEQESAVAPADDLIRFDAAHAFAFAIMDNITGTPLFEGTVTDPS